jgi:hypothetical protein
MFIVIDTFDTFYPSIVVQKDTGMPLIFETRQEAEKEAEDCQGAVIVEI